MTSSKFNQLKEKEWDVIVIGSGIGGLSLAGFLSKNSKLKVLVIEAHDKVGGFSHEFTRRQKFIFDVGVHYVGGLSSRSFIRENFDYLTEGRLQWNELPTQLDIVHYQDSIFTIPCQREEFASSLKARFPDEEKAIETYFQDVIKLSEKYLLWQFLELFPSGLQAATRKYLKFFAKDMFDTTQSYFDRNFSSDELKLILSSQWPGFGIPPSQSSFGFHCVHVSHYLDGAWYPEGGGGAIAKALIPSIRSFGGEVVTGVTASKILTENGKAVGVSVSTKDQNTDLFCKTVISNIGAQETYNQLVDKKDMPTAYTTPPKNPFIPSAVVVFLGLKDSPKKLGFSESNYWFTSEGPNAVAITDSKKTQLGSMYLSFPSLKRADSSPTAEIIISLDGADFDQWKDTHWMKRPEEYSALKNDFLHAALKRIDEHYPGFSDLVSFSEVASPRTIEHFQGNKNGAIFGLASTPEKFHHPWSRSKSPIKNLYLVGADSYSSGVIGAFSSAIKVFAMISQKKHLLGPLYLYNDIRKKIRAVRSNLS